VNLLQLVGKNLRSHRARSILTAGAVAIGVTMVVTLGVLTYSLRQTAVSILRTGRADFSVAQEGVSDLLYSSLDASDLERIRGHQEVESAIGVLVATSELDDRHPLFLELGLEPEQLAAFGVTVVAGRAYTATATDELMLGYRAAADLHKQVGDQLVIDETSYRVVGLYSTGQVFGDLASMVPLTTLQAAERKPGGLTLAFVRVRPGADIDALRDSIEAESPQLATVRTESEFGRVDRNLELLTAANLGGSILALVIGAVGVMNTTLLSFFERTREFGVLRAIGWSRRRLLVLVLSEAFAISLLGASLGVAGAFAAVAGLRRLPDLLGIFDPTFTSAVFGRALGFAFAMSLLGALYPAARAARLLPIEAVRHE
jgi:putative ABC transport system permease protein